jgi:SnoaL-like domain
MTGSPVTSAASAAELASVLADKSLIAELAQAERRARDAKDWGLMLDCYHGDARIFLSWIDGSAAEFVRRSQRMADIPGGHAIHHNGMTLVRLSGDRALADTSCAILMRRHFDGVECDMTGYCRHRSRVERRAGTWRLLSLTGVYEKNTLVPVVPGTAPKLDKQRLAGYRRSYNFQCYHREQEGNTAHDDRPGTDRPDLVEALEAADRAWLAGADVPLGVGEPR